jgi:hypothetical protein
MDGHRVSAHANDEHELSLSAKAPFVCPVKLNLYCF